MPILEWNLDETTNVQKLYNDLQILSPMPISPLTPWLKLKRKKKLDVSGPYNTNELKCLIREKQELKKLFIASYILMVQDTEQEEIRSVVWQI